MYKTISQCRVCGNTELDSLLDLGELTLTGIFPPERTTPVSKGPLELVKCRENGPETCGLVQLRHSFEPGEMYGANYGYRSGLNRSMVEHLQSKARNIKNTVSLSPNDVILDIGSNDSTFLRAMDAPGLRLVGMDPTGVKFHEYYPEHIQLIPDFFSAHRFRGEFGARPAKVVTSFAMFYDLEDPVDFVRQIYEILADNGVWVFEQSYLPTMLASTSYDTICHEHLEYYALKQILWMLDRVGFKVVDVELNDTNGGSFSVTAAKKNSDVPKDEIAIGRLLRDEERAGLGGRETYHLFRERVFRRRDELQDLLRRARDSGERVFGYGASTKGNVILQFCGITANELAFVAEVNRDKFGAFTPGTLIPIISEEEAKSMDPSGFLVLPWHFREHIVRRESGFLSSGGKLIFPLPELKVIRDEESLSGRVQWAGWELSGSATRVPRLPSRGD